MLSDPPAVAQPDAKVAHQYAGDVAGSPGAKYLAMPGIMAQEAHLGEQHRQKPSDCQRPPRVAHDHEGRSSACQRSDGHNDLPRVVERAAVKQSCFPDQS
jgi:hypothetical protein